MDLILNAKAQYEERLHKQNIHHLSFDCMSINSIIVTLTNVRQTVLTETLLCVLLCFLQEDVASATLVVWLLNRIYDQFYVSVFPVGM